MLVMSVLSHYGTWEVIEIFQTSNHLVLEVLTLDGRVQHCLKRLSNNKMFPW